MVKAQRFVVARGNSNRPACQHAIKNTHETACGQDMSGWSRQYMPEALTAILCLRCARITGTEVTKTYITSKKGKS